MTLRFVKTSILSSSDGIDFATEVAVESEEVLKTRVAAEAAANVPLYQQLADIRDRKKLEYDEIGKKIFAPPRALDDEDIEFFNDLDDAKARTVDLHKRHVDAELEAFRESRRIEMLKETTDLPPPTINFLPPKKVEQPLKVGLIVKAKRKVSAESVDSEPVSNKKKVIEDSAKQEVHVAATSQASASSSSAIKPASTTDTKEESKIAATSLFGEYDSD